MRLIFEDLSDGAPLVLAQTGERLELLDLGVAVDHHRLVDRDVDELAEDDHRVAEVGSSSAFECDR